MIGVWTCLLRFRSPLLQPLHHEDTPSIPLRPIVSDRGSAYHPLSWFHVEIVTLLMGPQYIPRTLPTLLKKINYAPIHTNQMVILDVVSLFTRVPTHETLPVIQNKLAADIFLEKPTYIPIDNLTEMLTFCVETTYFGMGSDIYRQEEGLSVRSPLSPVLTNVFMEYFKEIALGSPLLKPSLWLSYVDTFIL